MGKVNSSSGTPQGSQESFDSPVRGDMRVRCRHLLEAIRVLRRGAGGTQRRELKIEEDALSAPSVMRSRFKKMLALVQKDATPHPSWMQALMRVVSVELPQAPAKGVGQAPLPPRQHPVWIRASWLGSPAV